MMTKDEKTGGSPLSAFIRNASPERKRDVYRQVIERANQRQQAVLEKAVHKPS
ncbi:hypothetical protein M8009_03820 [Halomonas sp. ATCH28]|uniref:Uncharacterized protein n=1 Tax=Halomonas gemina TaxID=2945105 RepID=A0ABT0SXP1_9GAMM|nr:hypothetical protein [Halomonas gemina]MCL7939433.1 hypothetical protein [Halomonas gemina]